MYTTPNKTQENKPRAAAGSVAQLQTGNPFVPAIDNRPEAIMQRERQQMANDSVQVRQLKAYQQMANEGRRMPAMQMKSDKVIQRAIGAEIETNLQVQKADTKTPMVGKHEDLVGTIDTPFGRQNIVIDTGTILEITTDPQKRATVAGVSELPDLLDHFSRTMLPGNDPRFNINLTEKFAAGVVGFKSGTGSLMGDIQVNVSPTNAASVSKYYQAVAERRNALEKSADDDLEPLLKSRIWEQQKLDIVREAIQYAVNAAITRQARVLTLVDDERSAEVRGTESILIQTIVDMVMNLNLRPGDSATDKNKLDILPKFDIQEMLNGYCVAARGLRPNKKRAGNERAILFSSLSEAIEGSSGIIRKMEKLGAVGSILNMLNDVSDVVLNGRKTIRNRKGPSEGNAEMDPLVNKKTSTNMIPKENAKHGVYEDRNPFKPSLTMGSLGVGSWASEMLRYEGTLLGKGVQYLEP